MTRLDCGMAIHNTCRKHRFEVDFMAKSSDFSRILSWQDVSNDTILQIIINNQGLLVNQASPDLQSNNTVAAIADLTSNINKVS